MEESDEKYLLTDWNAMKIIDVMNMKKYFVKLCF